MCRVKIDGTTVIDVYASVYHGTEEVGPFSNTSSTGASFLYRSSSICIASLVITYSNRYLGTLSSCDFEY